MDRQWKHASASFRPYRWKKQWMSLFFVEFGSFNRRQLAHIKHASAHIGAFFYPDRILDFNL